MLSLFLLFKSSHLASNSSQHSARSGCLATGSQVPVAALRALVAHPLPRIGIYTAAALKSPLRPSQSPDGISIAILHRLNRRGIISRTKKLVKRFYGHHTKSAPQRDSRSLGGILCLLALAASVNFNSRRCDSVARLEKGSGFNIPIALDSVKATAAPA